jgi:hypothetical protein
MKEKQREETGKKLCTPNPNKTVNHPRASGFGLGKLIIHKYESNIHIQGFA